MLLALTLCSICVNRVAVFLQPDINHKSRMKIILIIIMQLPSLALDSGIHARMTGLKIVASNQARLGIYPVATF